MTVNVELMLACNIKATVSEQVEETLKYLTRKEDFEFNAPPLHPFFDSSKNLVQYQDWRYIFQQSEDLAPCGPILGYFPGIWICEFYEGRLTIRIDAGSYSEFVDTYIPFLNWLAPYIDTEEYGEFIGYLQGENTITKARPVLLFCKEEKIYYCEVSSSFKELDDTNLTKLFYGRLPEQ